ncbi:alpha-galactosidase [Tsuneonella sp. HG249]
MTRAPARLDGAEWSAVVEQTTAGDVVWRHLGESTSNPPSGPLERWLANATFSLDSEVGLPLLPTRGLGWFGPAALELRRLDGTGLPVAFSESSFDHCGNRLRIELGDPVSHLWASVELVSLPGGALNFSAAIENRGVEAVVVERLPSAVFPLPAYSSELRSWRGVHAAELAECREAMPAHSWLRETRRGIGGHGGPPGFYCLAEGATRDTGIVFALQLAWSGNTRLAIERNDQGGWIASAEACFEAGEVVLEAGSRYTSPAAYLAISALGTNGAMTQHHAAVRASVRWPGGAMQPRPVHLNTWEACYFAHDEARIGALAETAADMGVERFVLDDGWFKGRRDDRRALGDWTPDPVIYPNGLGPLARKVEALGMQFGLWVEPEMVNPDSDLYRAHPDWVLALPDRDRPTARHQLVLDMRRPDVRDYLFASLDRLLRDAPIGYLKWDHNRDLAPPGGATQVAGTYDLISRLRTSHPSVEIESCAGGGGRSDAGIAAYTHRFWTSDNLDAVARVSIQRGFAAFLPQELMGAHIGAAPAHATGRSQSLNFRAAIASMGHFGIELDPTLLAEGDKARLSEWISFYKAWRSLIHCGQVHLGEGEGIVWQAHHGGDRCLLYAIRTSISEMRRSPPLPLPCVRGGEWNVRLLKLAGPSRWLGAEPWGIRDGQSVRIEGDWLAKVGLPLPPLAGESVAIFLLERP